MNYRSEVAAVKRLTKRIESSEAEAEAAKWERAERLAGLVADGASRVQVGRDVGLSNQTVSAAVRIWERYGSRVRGRPRYADADYEVQGRGPAQRPEPPGKIAERVAADPAIAQAIAAHPAAARQVRDAEGAMLEVPGRSVLLNAADSINATIRITGPVGHIRNVSWKEARKIAEVVTPRRTERDSLVELAGDLRVYADEFESLGTQELDSSAFGEWLDDRGADR